MLEHLNVGAKRPSIDPLRVTQTGRRLPVGAGAAKQLFTEMRSLSIARFRRTLGTAAPGQEKTVGSVSAGLADSQLSFITPHLERLFS